MLGKKVKNQEKIVAKTEKSQKKSKEILVVTYLFTFAFLSMIAYLVYFMVVESEEAVNNSYNPRQEILANRNTRGIIYSADREVLAKTETVNDKEQRIYPYDNLFAHVVGYSTNGKMGVESLANFQLITSDTFIGDKIQNEIANEKSPGNNVVTTLNVALQQIAFDSLGVYDGAIIVTEPKTGKILAMVSKPDFNPNNIDKIWSSLVEDKKSSVLLNRATQGLYPPGSTFKIVMALEYLRQNSTTYQNYSYQCNGKFTINNDTIRCYHGTKHGQVDLQRSFAKSCNSSFAYIGSNLNIPSFQKTLEELLFNVDLPIKMPYKISNVTLNENTTESEILQTSIGQGKTQITPIHMAMITSAIANDGTLMVPYVIDRIETASGTIVKQYTKDAYGTIMTAEEADILTGLMEDVVLEGTATKLKGLSYTAAGKTGSAEYNGVKEDSHAWFTGFAPVENPQIQVTIIIEEAGSGGDYAVPIAKRLFDAYFE